MPTGTNIEADTQAAMVTAYVAGATCYEAAATFGLSKGACRLALKRAGVVARSNAQAQRHYDLDESFFETIDTEEKAYWLGFFSADGCVYGHRLTLTLSATDEEHLQSFKRALKWGGPIYKIRAGAKGGPCVSVSFASKPLAIQLAALGVHARKTYSLRPWARARQSTWEAAYWRGFVDGDGCLNESQGRRRITFVGTKAVVEGFRKFARRAVESEATISRKSSIFGIEIGGRVVATRLAFWLYEGATVALSRKHEIAKRWIEPAIKRST